MGHDLPSNIGEHRLHAEGSDTLVVTFNGDVKPEHMTAVYDAVEALGGETGAVIVLQDVSNMGAFPAATRKVVGNDRRSLQVKSVISYGASFHVRVLFTMVQKGIRLVRPDNAPLHYVATEADARKKLAEERARIFGT
jgi:hypothetical protein